MKKTLAFLGDISDEDRIFANSVADKVRAAQERYRDSYTFFLGEGSQELARKVLASQQHENFAFFGGYEGADRKVLGIFGEYSLPQTEDFPVKALTFTYSKREKLTHRDFLGALMSMNVARETVGDILVNEGSTTVFLLDTAAGEAMRTIAKIGRTGVQINEGFDEDSLPEQKFSEITGTVSSLRADCIVALAARCSRTKAEQLISAGSVSVKGVPLTDGAKKLSEGDGFSVRGHGKYIFSKIGGSTKKERTFIELKKFI